ncbi:hypothetical protein [uncultured Varibaculum sp.]|uniref:hypothetical protein n=1 Tax=uncultured Varibaculum sp. TaxID=413896 RepID=UPI002889165D|nr:hypothetical protein [uncultured Varibaculum sp.]
MNPDDPPLKRILEELKGIHYKAVLAQKECSDILYELPSMLDYLPPSRRQNPFLDNFKVLEKQAEAFENAANEAVEYLSGLPQNAREIRRALNEMRSEAENDNNR